MALNIQYLFGIKFIKRILCNIFTLIRKFLRIQRAKFVESNILPHNFVTIYKQVISPYSSSIIKFRFHHLLGKIRS